MEDMLPMLTVVLTIVLVLALVLVIVLLLRLRKRSSRVGAKGAKNSGWRLQIQIELDKKQSSAVTGKLEL